MHNWQIQAIIISSSSVEDSPVVETSMHTHSILLLAEWEADAQYSSSKDGWCVYMYDIQSKVGLF